MSPTPSAPPGRGAIAGVCLGLVLATLAVYRGVASFEFLNFDDDVYVTANPHVLGGVSAASLAWAATATYASNWHPLTWISHMLDVEMSGLDAGRHHVTSLLLHAASAVLLFLALRRMTGALWRPALVAALFALHPLHVESVAWVAERKDVLSAFFAFATLLAWLGFLESRTAARYALVLVLFALGLAAKPMLVTLPVVLLLLDVWPLGRGAMRVREKAPLFAMAAASSLVTIVAQRRGGSLQGLEGFTLAERIGNALQAYAVYLRDTVWPASLHAAHAHAHRGFLDVRVAAAVAVLGAISVLAVCARRRAPYLAVGWAWYLVMLVPVIGIVQVGAQATADRYTYLPLVGVFLAAAWGLADLGRLTGASWPAPLVALAALVALAPVTRAQVGTWSSSITLFERVLEAEPDNTLAHNNLGRAYADRGDAGAALSHLEAAVRLEPDYVLARMNLGSVLVSAGRIDEGIAAYRTALSLRPDLAPARASLASALARKGSFDEAIAEYRRAISEEPSAKLYVGLGVALSASGRLDDAAAAYDRALALDPRSYDAANDRGLSLARLGRTAEAIGSFERALALRPDAAEAHNNLGVALANSGRMPEAVAQFEQAARLEPSYAEARANLEAARRALQAR